MLIAISDLRERLRAAASNHGVGPEGCETIADHFVDSELRGRSNHGVRRFCVECRTYASAHGVPVLTSERASLAKVDGRGSPGPIRASMCVDVVTRLAASSGIAAVGMTNSRRVGALGYWSERIARHGQFGVVMNSGPVDCAMPGSGVPLSGVNPISFAAPTSTEPIVGDFAMSLGTMGALWTARNEGRHLPPQTYLDEHGGWAADAQSARWAAIFGGHRGLALSTMIQLMTGSLFGSPMADAVVDAPDVGFLFIAIDISRIVEPTAFRQQNSEFAHWFDDRCQAGTDPADPRLCGTESARRRDEALASGHIDVDDVVLDTLEELMRTPRPEA